MNETLDLLERRKSVRAYEAKPVTREQRDAIVRAALRAPTAGNMMLYSILEIEDQALKDRLAVTCDHQPFIAKAPLVLVFLADYQRWFDFFKHSDVDDLCRRTGTPFRTPQEGDLMLAVSDALIAAQSAVVAAEALGLGSCYIGDIMENAATHRELLKLPAYAFPIAMVCFGLPTEGQRNRPQPTRYPEDLIVFRNTYRHLESREFAAMETEQASVSNEAVNAGQRVFLRKYASDFMLEMNRSVRELLKSWKGKASE